MSLVSNFPIKFDDTIIPFYPTTYDRNDAKIEVVNQTEDGHDDVEIKRTEKTSLSVAFTVNDRWTAIFRTYKNKPSFTVKIYNTLTKDYDSKTMRIEDYDEILIQYSEKSRESMGIYSVSFTLEEF